MGDPGGGAGGLDMEVLFKFLQSVPEAFPPSEDYGHDDDVHVVDQVGGKELADCGRASANADVQAAGGIAGNLEGVGGAGVDEVERRATLHLN